MGISKGRLIEAVEPVGTSAKDAREYYKKK
ncbi:hypothetical protein [Dyadobacter sp. CY356]